MACEFPVAVKAKLMLNCYTLLFTYFCMIKLNDRAKCQVRKSRLYVKVHGQRMMTCSSLCSNGGCDLGRVLSIVLYTNGVIPCIQVGTIKIWTQSSWASTWWSCR